MSEQTDNRVPQPPFRLGESGARGEDTVPSGMIELSGAPRGIRPLPAWAAIAWCVAAGVCAGISPIIAPLFAGFGYALKAGAGGLRERALAALCLIVPAVLCSLGLRLTGVEDAVFACIVGMVGSHLYIRGKLTPGVACLAVAVLSALFMAVSEAVARFAGTTLAEQFELVLDVYLDSFEATSIEMRAALAQMRGIVSAIWPTAFVMIAFIGFVLSLAGAKVAVGRQRLDIGARETVDTFDLPLWMVGCLVAAIVILTMSRALPAQADLLTMAGGTLLCSLRLAFAVQGYAVLSFIKHARGWYGLIGLVISVIAVFLEFNMFVLTIVGVLDVWLNMRHLSRGVRVTVQDPADRSK